MPNVQISVVVPAYNEEELLPRCLKSLRNQDYTGQYEIVVVDNGSQDATATIARQYFAKLIYCSRKGVVYAREAGANAALGNIIVQADADTVYPKHWLSRIASYFSQHPDTAALAGSYVYDNHPWWARFEYFSRYFINKSSQIIWRSVPFISGANFAFRREAYLQAGGYSEKSLYPDQWGIAHRLSRTGSIDYDRTLRVRTSSRRVEKPIHVILFEIMSNFAGVVQHFGKYLVTPQKAPGKKIRRSRAVWIVIALAVIVGGVLVWGHAVPSSQIFGQVY